MKSFTVTFSPVAIDDIEQTVNYYEKQQPGLGKRFAAQLQVTLNAINRNPFFASVRYDDISVVLLLKSSPTRFTIVLTKMKW